MDGRKTGIIEPSLVRAFFQPFIPLDDQRVAGLVVMKGGNVIYIYVEMKTIGWKKKGSHRPLQYQPCGPRQKGRDKVLPVQVLFRKDITRPEPGILQELHPPKSSEGRQRGKKNDLVARFHAC